MTTILIPTKPDDIHAICVKLALEKKGHSCTLWHIADFPEQQTHTFEFKNNELFWQAAGTDFRIKNINEFDVVWLRRPQKPLLPDYLHIDDIENAQKENEALFKTFWQVIAPNAFWINPIQSINSVNCKLQQLKIAASVGLTVPETLVSNNPFKIKKFIQENECAVIYKPLYPVSWLNQNEVRLTYTDEIRLDDLPSDLALQGTTSIFQRKILKAFELRITYFGNFCIAAKLLSQQHPRGIIDWRYVPPNELCIEPFSLPEKIHEKCKSFMQKFGIVFGCFDFIVTPEGEYYFLEINEQGQFLWIENVNPDFKMLDIFTEFVLNGKNYFSWNQKSTSLKLAEVEPEVDLFLKNSIKLHKADVA